MTTTRGNEDLAPTTQEEREKWWLEHGAHEDGEICESCGQFAPCSTVRLLAEHERTDRQEGQALHSASLNVQRAEQAERERDTLRTAADRLAKAVNDYFSKPGWVEQTDAVYTALKAYEEARGA